MSLRMKALSSTTRTRCSRGLEDDIGPSDGRHHRPPVARGERTERPWSPPTASPSTGCRRAPAPRAPRGCSARPCSATPAPSAKRTSTRPPPAAPAPRPGASPFLPAAPAAAAPRWRRTCRVGRLARERGLRQQHVRQPAHAALRVVQQDRHARAQPQRDQRVARGADGGLRHLHVDLPRRHSGFRKMRSRLFTGGSAAAPRR
jgi:pyruvate/2-oxoglutarate dehydrogenase complex dihydrolipoamide acyltransferase (E2) component